MPLDTKPAPRFDVHPMDACRVVIMEGVTIIADLGAAKDTIMAEALAEFLARALDLGAGRKTGP